MKTSQIHIRLSPDEKERIKHLAKGNVSRFIVSRILGSPIAEKVPQKPTSQECIEKNMLPAEIEALNPRRCMKSHCKSTEAKLVMIHGMKAFLCRVHENDNIFA